jgi:pimeloyl-ACP methyl ester carboxylesterase
VKLYFKKYGSGKPLIILHGLFGQSDNWNTLAKKYGENGFETYVVDQRNHGLSPHSADWNYKRMAEDLNEFILDNNLEKPILMGHSMGGKTIMFFEMLFPTLSQKIVIADMSPMEYPPHHKEVLEALNSVDLENISSRKAAENKLNEFDLDFGTKQFLLKNLFWDNETGKKLNWRFNLKTITKEYDNIRVALTQGKSYVEALFVRGEKSNYISASGEIEIIKHFPNSKIVTIENSGHWIHAEKPIEYFEETIKFLNN